MSQLSCDDQDAQDMARLAGGHDAALNDLMHRHAERLFHYLLRSLQNEEDAADLAQETFARVYQHRARYDPRQKFSTWLYAVASNLVRDRYRWRARHPQASLDAESESTEASLKDTIACPAPTPDQELQSSERAETVRHAIAALPEELRQPLILSVYEELPQAEIATILDCTVKAVETRIYRARQQLKTSLQKLVKTSSPV
jgi:RNA polymerase sigma-70 factor (ECF subfamily)